MKPGDTAVVTADSLSRLGDGVGTVDDVSVHVTGLLPGETGHVAIEYVSRHRATAHASILERRTTHPGRRRAPCPHHGTCNGCPLMDLTVQAQRELKIETLQREQGLEVDKLVGGEGLGYRYSSKRVVAGSEGNLMLGSYMRGTHNVADMAGCITDHPDLVEAFAEFVEVANELECVPFNSLKESGDMRYVWAKTDGHGQVLLTVITAEPFSPSVWELTRRLQRPSGMAWGVQSGRANDMRGLTVRPLKGRQSLEVDMCGVKAHVGPQGFLQPNPCVAGEAYHALVQMPAGGHPHGKVAFDLYAGAGVTTDLLRAHFAHVVPCESYPESARALGIKPQLVEEFLADVLASPKSATASPDLVIANPPRGGLGQTVCDQLNILRAPRLHIMSCAPASLAEDLKRLTGPGGSYNRVQARAYDTLPQTPHVELVVWLVGKA